MKAVEIRIYICEEMDQEVEGRLFRSACILFPWARVLRERKAKFRPGGFIKAETLRYHPIYRHCYAMPATSYEVQSLELALLQALAPH